MNNDLVRQRLVDGHRCVRCGSEICCCLHTADEGPSAEADEIKRVLVLGCPGSGKTTFARELCRRTGLPLHHLDDYYWGQDWTRLEPDQWAACQRSLIAEERWIIDGNYLSTVGLRVPRADAIVVMVAPTMTCIARTIVRARRIQRGQWSHLPARIREDALVGRPVPASRDFFALLWKILRFGRVHAPKLLQLTRENADAIRIVAVDPGVAGRHDLAHRRRQQDEWAVLPLADVAEFIARGTAAGNSA